MNNTSSIVNDYVKTIKDKLLSLNSRDYYIPHSIIKVYDIDKDELNQIIDLLDELKELVNE